MGKKGAVFPRLPPDIRVWAEDVGIWRTSFRAEDELKMKRARVFVTRMNEDNVYAVRIESGRTRESYIMPSTALKKYKWKGPHRLVAFKSADIPLSTLNKTLALGTFMDISLMAWLLLNKNFTCATKIFEDLMPARVSSIPPQNPFLVDVSRLSVSYRILRRKLASYPSLNSLLYSTELPIAQLLLKMTSYGVPYRAAGLKKAEKALMKRCGELKAQLPASLNPSSPQQVHVYLYDTLHLPSPPSFARGERGLNDGGRGRDNKTKEKNSRSTSSTSSSPSTLGESCAHGDDDVVRSEKKTNNRGINKCKRSSSTSSSPFEGVIQDKESVDDNSGAENKNEGSKAGERVATDESTLDKLVSLHPHVRLIQEYRKVMKTLSSFVRPYMNKAEPNIHATFLQTATVTGRFSCQDPNLQQVPTNLSSGLNLRDIIYAPPGHRLVAMDYAQMEVRMLAHFVGEGPLRNAFRDETADVYTELTKHVFATSEITPESRDLMKTVVLSIIYGSGKQLIADKLGITVELATKFSRDFHIAFPEVGRWQKDVIRQAEEAGYCETITGRRRFLPLLKCGSTNWEKRSEARRHCINTIIQGSSADLLKRAMLNCDQALDQKFPAAIRPRLILCIHDELMFNTRSEIHKKVIRIARNEMVGAGREMDLQVLFPTVVKSGKSWGSLKKLKKYDQ